MTDNAIYTPTPTSLRVTVYEADGEIRATSAVNADHLIFVEHQFAKNLRHEVAPVVGRGNLTADGNHRYYQVQLADGSLHYVVGDGS